MSFVTPDKRGKVIHYGVVFKDPVTGRRKQKAGGTRKKDAEALRRRIDSEIANGTFEKYDDIMFSEMAVKWLEESVAPRLKQTTVTDYQQIVKNHLDPFFGKYKLKSITVRLVQEYVSKKMEEPLSPRTISKTITALHTMFSYAVRMEYIAENPARYATRPRQVKTEHVYLDQEQLRRLLNATSPEYFALFATAALTGARKGELIALQWKDVDLNRGLIRIGRSYNPLNTQSDPKTQTSRRSIVISDELVRVLRAHKENVRESELDLVFPNKSGKYINRQNMMTREFHPALERAGLPPMRFHDLRHTYAAIVITMGENIKFIQKQLGHASLTITMDTYGHLLPEASHEFGERLDSFIFAGNVLTFPSKSDESAGIPESGDVDDVWTA